LPHTGPAELAARPGQRECAGRERADDEKVGEQSMSRRGLKSITDHVACDAHGFCADILPERIERPC
jgi:hypothetical protein